METNREIKTIEHHQIKNVMIIKAVNIKLLAEARARQKATKILA